MRRAIELLAATSKVAQENLLITLGVRATLGSVQTFHVWDFKRGRDDNQLSRMSFWKSNPMVPSWTAQISSWWSSYPPRLLETRDIRLPTRGEAYLATQEDLHQLPEFWARWFSTPSCRCLVPLKHIQNMVKAGRWEILVVRNRGEIIGTLVHKFIKGLHVKGAFWPMAGMIDYFAIHPAWRKKGVGRCLLSTLHNMIPTPIPPQLILWEGIKPSIPPLSIGSYWSKRCVQGPTLACSDVQIWKQLVSVKGIWSDYEAHETQIFKTSSGFLAIWNTFHRSIPDGLSIGIIVAYSSKEAVEEFTMSSSYGILLSDTQINNWNYDSPYQWIAYNLNPGFTDLTLPAIGF